jgi:hypothetical protein
MLGSPDKELGQMIMGFKDSNLGLELFVIDLIMITEFREMICLIDFTAIR